MALIPCPECDGRASTAATACPHCGYPDPAGRGPVDRGFEYRSAATLFGWPLLAVTKGVDPATGKLRVARGVVAVGGLAVGGVAAGLVSVGGVALGVVALGGVAVAAVAAVGGGAVGYRAVGGAAVGVKAVGGVAVGREVVSGTGRAFGPPR